MTGGPARPVQGAGSEKTEFLTIARSLKADIVEKK
jgi:hypothetical protein